MLERNPQASLLAVGALFLAAYVLGVTVIRPQARILQGDAVYYYVYLRSLVFDRDVDFRNDYALLYGSPESGAARRTTATGHALNVVSIGPAILWLPFFCVALAAVWLLSAVGLYAGPIDGVAAPFQLSAGVAGVAYATLGAIFCFRSARRLYPEAAAFWGTLAAWLASPALYYSVISPAYSHSTSLFAGAGFACFWLSTRGDLGVRRFLAMGLLGGVAALVRWQDAIVLLLPALEVAAVVRDDARKMPAAITALAAMGLAGALVVLPQALAWRAMYGQSVVVPGRPGYIHWTSPKLLAVLLGHKHGLFYWTPAMLPAVAGLCWVARRDSLVGWGGMLVVLISIYVNGSADPGAGEAFGARRFVANTVFFSLGLAALAAAWRERREHAPVRAAATALVVYNFLLLVQYQAFMHGLRDLVPYPTTAREILLDRFVVPWRLLRHWLAG